MKVTSLPSKPRKVWLMMLLLAQIAAQQATAQMPDCLSNTYMYGVISPKQNVDAVAPYDSTEIREISFATGAVGQLMGGRRYYIRKKPASSCGSCPFYYGSAAMGLDPTTGRFYLITQMGSGGSGGSTAFGDKDIVMIDPLAPTATGTVVGTIASLSGNNMDDYHFVKAAVSPNGWGYAVGVHRRSNFTPLNRFNPVIRYSLCSTPGCSTIQLLGYISDNDPISTGMNLFNGDITFDAAGNLYFFASAFASGFYTESRLFRINVADIPNTPGTGEIPISFIADYDDIDSTGASGLVMSANGNLYLTLRHYDYSADPDIITSRLYASYDTSSVIQMTGFGPIDDTLSAGDLAACYFPSAILPVHDTKLTARSVGGNANLRWEVNDNDDINNFEVLSSSDGENYSSIATVYPSGTGEAKAFYDHTDQNASGSTKYYRIRKIMKSGGLRYYSNVERVYLGNNLNMVARPTPNPFMESISFQVKLNSSQKVEVRLFDQSGRTVVKRNYNGNAGVNSLKLDGFSSLKPGIYVLEVSAENEVIREKLIRQ